MVFDWSNDSLFLFVGNFAHKLPKVFATAFSDILKLLFPVTLFLSFLYAFHGTSFACLRSSSIALVHDLPYVTINPGQGV